MKKILLFTLLSCLVLGELQAQKKEIKMVTQSFDKLIAAMIKADAMELVAIVSDDLDYGHSSGLVQDKSGFIQEVVSKNPMAFQSIERENETIKISGNTAVMRNTLIIRGHSPAGEAINLRLGAMMVWKKEKKQWKLFARQAFRLPN